MKAWAGPFPFLLLGTYLLGCGEAGMRAEEAAEVPARLRQVSIEDLLPSRREGWELVPGSYIYCADRDSLYDMYDGAAGLWMNAGVVEAVAAVYRVRGADIGVNVHRMKSAEAAGKFVDHWRREGGGNIRPHDFGPGRLRGFVQEVAGIFTTHLAGGELYVSVSSSGPAEGALGEVLAYLREIPAG